MAGILTKGGADYVFRHDLHRQAVLDTMPEAMRLALHLDAARSKARSGAPAIEVTGGQLMLTRQRKQPSSCTRTVVSMPTRSESRQRSPGTEFE